MKKIIGSQNDREIRRLAGLLDPVAEHENDYRELSNRDFQAKTQGFQERVRSTLNGSGESPDEAAFKRLEDELLKIMPEAFALAREAARRTLGMRPFDVQLIGGLVLHMGRIAEMKTGEGKTLVASLPLYLNGLTGFGAHLVTVNDYLARRDATWMGPIYKLLGIDVGVINHEISYLIEWEDPARAEKAIEKNQSVWPDEYRDMELPPERNLDVLAAFKTKLVECTRKEAYKAHVTYGTNNEFGFDYLRDNMKFSLNDYVQREHNFAIVDEVDSILIDEARTPLIISGPSEDSTQLYYDINGVVKNLKNEVDFTLDEKTRQVTPTEEGSNKVEHALNVSNVYDPANIELLHHVIQGLRAHNLFHRDVDYMVKDGKVIIVDEFTGRLMPGRRWSDGLHQAIEAKEGVEIENENQTLATITIQNYFRMYRKLAGMTGTADTEAFEFKNIYKLDVNVIPTNRPMVRVDRNDLIYKSEREKFDAVAGEIKEHNANGRPILVGTTSIEKSEKLSKLLEKQHIPHKVLNAKQHESEAQIVAQAGRPGMVTIATNMAGRGTDIVLGGNIEKPVAQVREDEALSDADKDAKIAALRADWQKVHDQVIANGGLHIIGTERHESRRIDNQLRGRSGRQGDPGSSRFYLSLEDPLMKIFAGERLNAIMVRLKMPEGEAIEHAMVTRSLESAQRKVEQRNFDIRKQLLEYDDVANDQRKVIYQQRNELLETDDITDTIRAMRQGVLHDIFRRYVPAESVEEQWEIAALEQALLAECQLKAPVGEWLKAEPSLDDDALLERIVQAGEETYAAKTAIVDPAAWHQFERNVMLQSLDTHWREHLAALDHLRQGIHLRGYAQKNPKQEYKREAFELFETLLDTVRADVTKVLMTVQIRTESQLEEAEVPQQVENVKYQHADYDEALGTAEGAEGGAQAPASAGPKVGRNDPCPCGSGKKYKHCHGKLN